MAVSEDVAEISAMVRDFADEQIRPRAGEWDRDKHFPVDVLRAAGGLGLGGIWVREDVGGSGLTRADGVRIFEQLATGCPTIAAYISIHNMATSMIDTAGTDEQRHRWVPRLAAMEDLASYCLTESGAGSDAAALRTTARRVDDGYVLDGAKQFISGAGTSAVYVVMARTGGPGAKGVSAFVVPAGTPGLSFGAEEAKMGWHAQPTREVVLDGVHVPTDHLLGEEGQGFAIAMKGLDGGAAQHRCVLPRRGPGRLRRRPRPPAHARGLRRAARRAAGAAVPPRRHGHPAARVPPDAPRGG